MRRGPRPNLLTGVFDRTKSEKFLDLLNSNGTFAVRLGGFIGHSVAGNITKESDFTAFQRLLQRIAG